MSRLLRVLVGVAAVGVVVAAFRNSGRGRASLPALPFRGRGGDEDDDGDGGVGLEVEEPILGYDGMDRDTLLEWLDDADLDRATLMRIRGYEEANLARQSVLDALDDMLD